MLKDKALEIIPKYGKAEAKVGPRVAERMIFEALQLILALYFKMSVALSGLVLIRIFFRRHIFVIFMPTSYLTFTRNTLNLLYFTSIFT